MTTAFDTEHLLDLGGLQPVDPDSADAAGSLWPDDLNVLAAHRTAPHGSHSYVVAHDTSATWGVPGTPQLVAMKLARNLSLGTFTMESEYHASVPFAQAWLIERGCPPEQITVPDGTFIEPADDLTLRTERKIREAGQRYDVLDSYTRDFDPYESWTVVRDTLADHNPVRVFLEQDNPKTFTYTLREGAFPDENTAQDWLDNRSTPFPQAIEEHLDAATLRTRVALTRSAEPAGRAACGLDRGPLPPVPLAQQQGQGRPR